MPAATPPMTWRSVRRCRRRTGRVSGGLVVMLAPWRRGAAWSRRRPAPPRAAAPWGIPLADPGAGTVGVRVAPDGRRPRRVPPWPRPEHEEAATATQAPAPHRATWLLIRSRHNRVLVGVAGGLGERLGVDPILVRVAFAVLAIAGGSGVVLYLLGWGLSAE